ncbi:hypothetical protein K7711_36460 [Nocardia sp. CA2R105]|uniref:hypothetical protein n=1 Tax=Nocardia coffeae TaxID=2873381 RepID=UPI001CA7A80E|nr:hypothetical protein [Nocardia coffeae]MBY8862017.1 hypothetical protein [Nocardia coffeae]
MLSCQWAEFGVTRLEDPLFTGWLCGIEDEDGVGELIALEANRGSIVKERTHIRGQFRVHLL